MGQPGAKLLDECPTHELLVVPKIQCAGSETDEGVKALNHTHSRNFVQHVAIECPSRKTLACVSLVAFLQSLQTRVLTGQVLLSC